MIAVTGSQGFLGRAITRMLREDGHYIRRFDAQFGHDVCQSESCRSEGLHDVSTIVHCASPCSALMFREKPRWALIQTIRGMITLMTVAPAAHLIVLSTCTLYGDSAVPVSESAPLPVVAPNAYAGAKRHCEELAALHTQMTGHATVLRVFTGYGPGDTLKGVYASPVGRFLDALTAGETPVIYGTGEQVRDFVYVDDVARAVRDIVVAGQDVVQLSTLAPLYNVGTGIGTSFNTVYELLQEVTGIHRDPVYVPAPDGYVGSCVSNSLLLQQHTGWTPRIDLREGLRRAVEAQP